MKVLVKLDELISHRRLFRNVKDPKRLAETAQVTISTSEQFSITPEDLADLVARKRDIKDNRRFKGVLFSRHSINKVERANK